MSWRFHAAAKAFSVPVVTVGRIGMEEALDKKYLRGGD